MYFKYDSKAEQECKLFAYCKTCKGKALMLTKARSLECPTCNKKYSYGFRCEKCKKVYFPTTFQPRVCPLCHPELTAQTLEQIETYQAVIDYFFPAPTETAPAKPKAEKTAPPKPMPAPEQPLTPTEKLVKKIREAEVTYLSDKPTGPLYDRELYDEWYRKLDPAHLEQLRDNGEDPYDIWR